MKCILLSNIWYDPLKILAGSPAACGVAAVPTAPLSTSTRLQVPIPTAGPKLVVPKPTFLTIEYSSSILIRSPDRIDPIPLSTNAVTNPATGTSSS